MEDIETACKIIDNTAGEIGMTEEDRRRANDLLKEYGEKRESLFNGMVSLLGQSDVSSLDDDWKECCSNGKEALSNLNDAIPPRDGEGLTGVGLDSFHRGELKIWDENAKAEIALAAKAMEIIHLSDVTLIESCKKELETIKDDDEVIQEAVRDVFPSIISRLKDAAVNLGKLAATANSSGKFQWAKIFTDQAGSLFTDDFNQTAEWARKRGALKRRLLKQISIINDTNNQIGDWKIDETYERGEKCAESLQDSKDGDYEAADWEEFGEKCKDALEKKRDEAKDKSEELFKELYPTLMQQNEMAFKTLCDDPSKLESWNNEIDKQFQDIYGAIDAQDKLTASLADGPYKQAAFQTMNNVRNMIKASLDQYGLLKKTTEDEMNKE